MTVSAFPYIGDCISRRKSINRRKYTTLTQRSDPPCNWTILQHNAVMIFERNLLKENRNLRLHSSSIQRREEKKKKKNFPRRFVSDVTAPCGSSGGYISENIRSPAAEHRGTGHLLFFRSLSRRSRKRFATRERKKKIRKDWEMRLWAAPTSGMVSRRGSFWVCRTAEWAFPQPRTSVFNFSERQEVKSLHTQCNESHLGPAVRAGVAPRWVPPVG